MTLQTDIQALMQKKMDRRDFLKHVGIGFVAILGITTILRTMSSLGNNGQKHSVGYSSGAYGGKTTDAAPKQTL